VTEMDEISVSSKKKIFTHIYCSTKRSVDYSNFPHVQPFNPLFLASVVDP
jgi:hypothetical protein